MLVGNRAVTLPVGLPTYVFQISQDRAKLRTAPELLVIPTVLVFLAAERYLVSGLTRGEAKG